MIVILQLDSLYRTVQFPGSTSTELVIIVHTLENTLVDCDSEEEKAIAELTGLDAAIQRIEQAEAEPDEIISQVNLIDQLWQDQNWDELTRCIDALVEHIDLRVADDEVVARIRLRAMPIIREIMTVRPNEHKAPPIGVLSVFPDAFKPKPRMRRMKDAEISPEQSQGCTLASGYCN